jgi:hypothetical protein
MTIGIVLDARFAAATAGVLHATITATVRADEILDQLGESIGSPGGPPLLDVDGGAVDPAALLHPLAKHRDERLGLLDRGRPEQADSAYARRQLRAGADRRRAGRQHRSYQTAPRQHRGGCRDPT